MGTKPVIVRSLAASALVSRQTTGSGDPADASVATTKPPINVSAKCPIQAERPHGLIALVVKSQLMPPVR